MRRAPAGAAAAGEGPASNTGATGPVASVYFRDPGGTLIEVADYG